MLYKGLLRVQQLLLISKFTSENKTLLTFTKYFPVHWRRHATVSLVQRIYACLYLGKAESIGGRNTKQRCFWKIPGENTL